VQVVSEDGKKVKRQHPLTESDMEELQVSVIPFGLFSLDFLSSEIIGICICNILLFLLSQAFHE
jgi:hypothetical protein